MLSLVVLSILVGQVASQEVSHSSNNREFTFVPNLKFVASRDLGRLADHPGPQKFFHILQ